MAHTTVVEPIGTVGCYHHAARYPDRREVNMNLIDYTLALWFPLLVVVLSAVYFRDLFSWIEEGTEDL